MRQVKVTKTEQHTDSQGTHLVCRGKLVLIKTDEIICKENHIILYVKELDKEIVFKPIIISETEEIEVGDKYLFVKNGTVCTADVSDKDLLILKGLQKSKFALKILALPEQFSPKQLQTIVDGKLKDQDEVFIECEDNDFDFINTRLQGKLPVKPIIKLTEDNYIKLFPVKEEQESWDDIWKTFISTGRNLGGWNDWLISNYHPPIKK